MTAAEVVSTTWHKKIVNGHVGIVYSPGYGGGWSTWVTPSWARALALDSRIVTAVMHNMERAELRKKLEEWGYGRYKNLVSSDAKLRVGWVPQGNYVVVESYDGNERIKVFAEEPCADDDEQPNDC
jgi:hypothetical protein